MFLLFNNLSIKIHIAINYTISHNNHAIFTEIHSELVMDPAEFKCKEDSPTSEPVWSSTNPRVEMRHIFCGELSYTETGRVTAHGFHSLNPSTNWPSCAAVNHENQCKFYDNHCGECRDFMIGGYTKSYSSMWPDLLSPGELVPMFQQLYESCKEDLPPENSVMPLCFQECHWKNLKTAPFDIVIATDDERNIVSAYPIRAKSCRIKRKFDGSESRYLCSSSQVCQSDIMPRVLVSPARI